MLTFWNDSHHSGTSYNVSMSCPNHICNGMPQYLKVHTCASVWVMPLSFLLTVGMVFSTWMLSKHLLM